MDQAQELIKGMVEIQPQIKLMGKHERQARWG